MEIWKMTLNLKMICHKVGDDFHCLVGDGLNPVIDLSKNHACYYHSLVNSKKVKISLLLFLLCLGFSSTLQAEPNDNFFSLSLKELMQIQIKTSTLTATPLNQIPASITIISQEQIQRTPARNLMDLLVVYVPGLMVISNFDTGPILRIRGLGERHVQTLLLVNGKPVNQKTHQGSMVELRNWDMADIERVEVVRGPGSVTHGPGAISGVINIITKQANNEKGLRMALDYNDKYESKGLKLSYGTNIGGSDVLLHGSYTRTKGVTDYDVFQTLKNGELGYKGTEAFTGTDAFPLQAYYGDFDDKPQIKLYLDLDFNENWRFWSRYNNSGQTNPATQRLAQGQMRDWRTFQSRYYIASLENTINISQQLQLSSSLTYDSEDSIELKAKQADLANTHELNRSFSFSENETHFKVSLVYTPAEVLSFATTFEYSHDYISAPWGDPAGSFLVKTGGKAFITEDSVYFGDGSGGTIKESKVAEFTHGWSTNTYSLAAELKYQLTPKLQTIVSGRVDKNDQTQNMYSPRVALVYLQDENNILKISWQRSLRMNTLIELHWLDFNDLEAAPEHNSTYELSYSLLHNENLQYSVTAYHNESEIFSWDGDNANLVGVIKAYGIEPELSFRTETISFGINHSFYKLTDWNFLLKQEDGSVLQTVSYSDQNYTKDFLTLTGSGDALTNWANQQTKLWLDYQLNENWSFHMNARIIWEYEYGNDLFDMYQKAYVNVDQSSLNNNELAKYNEDKNFLQTFNQTINDKDIFGKDIRLNISFTWQLPFMDNAQLKLYSQNIVNFTDNKRQKHNFTTNTLPAMGWVEEPRTIGITFSVSL